MTKKDKYLVIFLSLIIIITLVMIIIIYFDYKSNRIELNTEKEEVNIEEYEGVDIPELTTGDTVEEIENDIESLNLEELDTEFNGIEQEIEELF